MPPGCSRARAVIAGYSDASDHEKESAIVGFDGDTGAIVMPDGDCRYIVMPDGDGRKQSKKQPMSRRPGAPIFVVDKLYAGTNYELVPRAVRIEK